MSDALTHAVQCVAHLTEEVRPATRARHLMTLAVALDDGGSPEEGDRRYREALDIAIQVGDDDLTLLVLNNMAYSAYENGRRVRRPAPGAADARRVRPAPAAR